MSLVGQTRKSVAATAESALPPGTDIVSLATQVRKVPQAEVQRAARPTRTSPTRWGTTERTIKAHRQRVMEKMQVRSLVELVSLAERVGVFASASEQTA